MTPGGEKYCVRTICREGIFRIRWKWSIDVSDKKGIAMILVMVTKLHQRF